MEWENRRDDNAGSQPGTNGISDQGSGGADALNGDERGAGMDRADSGGGVSRARWPRAVSAKRSGESNRGDTRDADGCGSADRLRPRDGSRGTRGTTGAGSRLDQGAGRARGSAVGAGRMDQARRGGAGDAGVSLRVA